MLDGTYWDGIASDLRGSKSEPHVEDHVE